jgi:hypothetical protein
MSIHNILKKINRVFFWIFIVLGIVLPIALYISITNPNNVIDIKNFEAMIQNLDNASITVASLLIAVIFAIITIIKANLQNDKKIDEKVIDAFMVLAAFVIFAVIFGLISLYESYFNNLNYASTLCGLSLGLTIFVLFFLSALFYFGKGVFLR